jgi:hypothetical protein
MYVFSIDIPFKRYSKSLSHMRSRVTVVSYLHNGVIDTAVHGTALSMILLCMSQQCNRHRFPCHSGVNDTAVPCAAESDFRIETVLQIICEDIRQSLLHIEPMTPLCNQLCRICSLLTSYIRKGFKPCIRGPGKDA